MLVQQSAEVGVLRCHDEPAGVMTGGGNVEHAGPLIGLPRRRDVVGESTSIGRLQTNRRLFLERLVVKSRRRCGIRRLRRRNRCG